MALPPFRLPRLQLRMPIVNIKNGTATTAFHRYLNVDVLERIEQQEASQAATDAALQAEIDRLNRVLAGLENFTGIQVGGQQVKPFLDKTDGDMLVLPSALDDGVVETRAVALQAVVESERFVDATSVSIGTTEIVLATVTVDALLGDVIDIATTVALNVSAATMVSIIRFRIYRDATAIYTGFVEYVDVGETRYSTPSPNFSEEPGVGTFVYTLQAIAITGGGTLSCFASNRFMRATRYLKTGG